MQSFVCQLCGKEFKNVNGLAAHISNKKSKCHMLAKDYYDRFLRKPGEGICKHCGKETMFVSLSKGYYSNICKRCKNKDPEIIKKQKESRDVIYEERKVKSGYYQYPEVCELCGKRFKTKQGLARHICQSHKDISVQEYYDRFLREDESEGICPITGKKTRFISLVEGYAKYYGKGTNSKSDEVKRKKEETLQKNFGVSNAVFVNQEQSIEKKRKKKEERDRKRMIQEETEIISQIFSIEKGNMKQCQICGKRFDLVRSLIVHVIKFHKIALKTYYDTYFRKDREGICPICGQETTFYSMEVGYFKYCPKCSPNCPEVREGIKKWSRRILAEKINTSKERFNVEVVNPEKVTNLTDKVELRCCKCLKIYVNSLYNLEMGYGKCPRCFRQPSRSHQEHILESFLNEILNGEDIIFNDKKTITNPETGRELELDILVPERKVAIEVNGLYWHSEAVLGEKAKTIHRLKYIECLKKDIQLLQFFEDEIMLKFDIVKSIIESKLGLTKRKIHSRACELREISSSEKSKFLRMNHIQGNDRSKVFLGLYFRDELVAAMTFGKGYPGGARVSDNDWILSRYATKTRTRVIGGASRLLDFFKKNYYWSSIYSYSDNRISNGNLYRKLGFKFIGEVGVDYSYFHGNSIRRIHRFELRKRPDEPKDVPEWVLRMSEGFYRIWDAGKLKFRLDYK